MRWVQSSRRKGLRQFDVVVAPLHNIELADGRNRLTRNLTCTTYAALFEAGNATIDKTNWMALPHSGTKAATTPLPHTD
jgi:hypothetical protein